MKHYTDNYIVAAEDNLHKLDRVAIQTMIGDIKTIKQQNGRLFILGIGGSAANASHAVNDFRKIARIDTMAPTDNVAEFTAHTNDESWEMAFQRSLEVSKLTPKDGLLILSVSGGSSTSSQNLIKAIEYAHTQGTKVMAITGNPGGETRKMADTCVVVPTAEKRLNVPLAEAFQPLIWHLIVNHPDVCNKK